MKNLINAIKTGIYERSLYPILLGLVFVLNVFRHKAIAVFDLSMLIFSTFSICFCFFTLWAARRIWGKTAAAGIMAFIIIGINLYCYTMFVWLNDLRFINTLSRPLPVVLALYLLFTLAIGFGLWRNKRSFSRFQAYLNFVFIAFLFIEIAQLAYNIPYTIGLHDTAFSPKGKLFNAEREKLPNIYYIILDSYTSSAQLKKYWQYDNTAFEDSLRAKGFFIATKSRSDYDFTPYCMASYLSERTCP